MFQIKKRSRTVQAWVYGTISILGVIGAFWFGYAVKPQETKSLKIIRKQKKTQIYCTSESPEITQMVKQKPSFVKNQKFRQIGRRLVHSKALDLNMNQGPILKSETIKNKMFSILVELVSSLIVGQALATLHTVSGVII